jgi:hypothetical protein
MGIFEIFTTIMLVAIFLLMVAGDGVNHCKKNLMKREIRKRNCCGDQKAAKT